MSTMKLACWNAASGSGKTLTALNIAGALARSGNHVLLVDGDPANRFSDMMGLSDSGVVLDRHATQIMRSSPVQGLSILCGFGASIASGKATDAAERLSRIGGEFDWMIFDCASDGGAITREILRSADAAIVPIQHTEACWAQLPSTLRTLREVQKISPALRLAGFVVSDRMPSDPAEASLAKATWKSVTDKFPSVPFGTQIPVDPAVSRALEHLLPIAHQDASAPAAIAFERLTAEVAARLGVAPAVSRRTTTGAGLSSPSIKLPDLPVYTPVSSAHNSARGGPISSILNWLSGLFGRR